MEEYLDLLPSLHRDRPDFAALVTAVLRQALDMRALVTRLLTAFDPLTAEGEPLDAAGRICGCTRGADETDEAFRDRILACAMRNAWDGTNGGLRELLAVYAPAASFADNQDLTVRAVGTDRLPVPAGVRLVG